MASTDGMGAPSYHRSRIPTGEIAAMPSIALTPAMIAQLLGGLDRSRRESTVSTAYSVKQEECEPYWVPPSQYYELPPMPVPQQQQQQHLMDVVEEHEPPPPTPVENIYAQQQQPDELQPMTQETYYEMPLAEQIPLDPLPMLAEVTEDTYQLPSPIEGAFGPTRRTCQWCQKTFARATDCRRHERIHSGEKPHKCYLCPAAFIQSSALTVHMRTHTGERPFACSFCGKGFSDGSSRKKHERTHRDAIPETAAEVKKKHKKNGKGIVKAEEPVLAPEELFSCPICPDHTYTRKDSLRKHMRRKHEVPAIRTLVRVREDYQPELYEEEEEGEEEDEEEEIAEPPLPPPVRIKKGLPSPFLSRSNSASLQDEALTSACPDGEIQSALFSPSGDSTRSSFSSAAGGSTLAAGRERVFASRKVQPIPAPHKYTAVASTENVCENGRSPAPMGSSEALFGFLKFSSSASNHADAPLGLRRDPFSQRSSGTGHVRQPLARVPSIGSPWGSMNSPPKSHAQLAKELSEMYK